jgi:hypothetical protein
LNKFFYKSDDQYLLNKYINNENLNHGFEYFLLDVNDEKRSKILSNHKPLFTNKLKLYNQHFEEGVSARFYSNSIEDNLNKERINQYVTPVLITSEAIKFNFNNKTHIPDFGFKIHQHS